MGGRVKLHSPEVVLHNTVYDKYIGKYGTRRPDIARRQVKPCKLDQLQGLAAIAYQEVVQIYKQQDPEDKLQMLEKVLHQVDSNNYLVPKVLKHVVDMVGQK